MCVHACSGGCPAASALSACQPASVELGRGHVRSVRWTARTRWGRTSTATRRPSRSSTRMNSRRIRRLWTAFLALDRRIAGPRHPRSPAQIPAGRSSRPAESTMASKSASRRTIPDVHGCCLERRPCRLDAVCDDLDHQRICAGPHAHTRPTAKSAAEIWLACPMRPPPRAARRRCPCRECYPARTSFREHNP